MDYYTSFCPSTPDVCAKIVDYIASLDLPVVCKIQHNSHELEDYKSVEVYWLHAEEFDDLEWEEERNEIQENRYKELDDELTRLNEMEDKVGKKFENCL